MSRPQNRIFFGSPKLQSRSAYLLSAAEYDGAIGPKAATLCSQICIGLASSRPKSSPYILSDAEGFELLIKIFVKRGEPLKRSA